jgi:cation:H+ antiporter
LSARCSWRWPPRCRRWRSPSPALRLGALDLALGNLLGSNLFNLALLALDDLAYTAGPLLSVVAPVHLTSAASALVMYGLVIVGLVMRPQGKVLRILSWISVGLVAAYGLQAALIYLAQR